MTARLAVLALVTDAYGGCGGIAQYNRDLLSALAGEEAITSIIVVPRSAPERAATPARIRQTAPRPGRLRYTLAVLREALSSPIDAVFCGHLFMAPLAFAVARAKRAKLIVQTHGIEAWQKPGPLSRAAVEAADLVLSVSRYTRAQVLAWAAMPPERALVLPNTMGENFTPGDAATLRARWGLQGKRVLLSVGRLAANEAYKGHDCVIETMPQLVAQGHDVIYLIVGEGDDRARLEALAARTSMNSRVRFLGALDAQTLADVYRVADLFVMPSTGEGFGIAFLEAMACGTPALGLAAAGAVDALGEGDLGAAVTATEFPLALAAALARPKRDAAALASAARARFGREHFVAGVHGAVARLTEAVP